MEKGIYGQTKESLEEIIKPIKNKKPCEIVLHGSLKGKNIFKNSIKKMFK
jgi:hypothetical protein